MRTEILELTNGYLILRERNGGLDPFEVFFPTYDMAESFLLKLLEHDNCIMKG